MSLENKKIVAKYFKKYFANQFFTEKDTEFRSLFCILNKKDQEVDMQRAGRVHERGNYEYAQETLAQVKRVCEKLRQENQKLTKQCQTYSIYLADTLDGMSPEESAKNLKLL